MSRNMRYEKCFVAYLDILGFKEKVRETEESPELLKELTDTLKINSPFTQSSGKKTTVEGKLDIRSFFFSDSFAFMMKVEKKNLPHLFLIVRYLHDVLLKNGLCLRGAVVIGKMYWPKDGENILVGPAMIEAHKLESEVAIYPRIVISQKLHEYIDGDRNIKTWSEDGKIPLSEFIKRDKDGVYFFDVLNQNITRKKGEDIIHENGVFSIVWDHNRESNYEQVIIYVNDIIGKHIKDENELVRQKYEWLKTYLEESRGKAP